jgi:AraC-like DNA-binding protein
MSKSAGSTRFIVDLGWQVLLKDLGLSPQDLLRRARLPQDLLSRPAPSLSTEEYFRLWDGMADLMDDQAFPLRLGQSIPVEAFSPPIFACFCSPDLNAALARLSQYKPLIGPMTLTVSRETDRTAVTLGGLPDSAPLPASLIATELVFLVHLARLATREHIEPLAAYVAADLPARHRYDAYFGRQVSDAPANGLVFSANDARRPFLTANEAMWSTFEPQLRTRLGDLATDATFRDRVSACLMESLAGGQCTMPDIAGRLAVSTRTLQRRLHDENTSFQDVLNDLREGLARHYLANTVHTSAEISFLLGYDDPNSFIRAFHAWTGQTPERVRSGDHLH